MATEAYIQRNIVKELEQRWNAYVIKTIASNRAGVPDIVCCIAGQFFAFEVKATKGGKTSELQKAHIDRVRKSGGYAVVVHSVAEVNNHVSEWLQETLNR